MYISSTRIPMIINYTTTDSVIKTYIGIDVHISIRMFVYIKVKYELLYKFKFHIFTVTPRFSQVTPGFPVSFSQKLHLSDGTSWRP